MTLEDDIRMKRGMHSNNNGNKMDVGAALRSALLQAREQGRLTCGVYESGKMLEINPEGVMLCILPTNVEEDVTLHIHFKLIEAFCWENAIQLLKVDSCEKLAKLLGVVNDNHIPSTGRTLRSEDFHCLVIEYPSTECSEDEEDVMAFCKATSDLPQLPVVELAV